MKIDISGKNYRKLIQAKEEMQYDTLDMTLEDVLDFWFAWSKKAKK